MVAAEESEVSQVLIPLASVVAAVVVAFGVAVVIGMLVRTLARRSVIASDLARRSKRPLRALLVVIAVWIALVISVPRETWDSSDWMGAVRHLLLIAVIGTATWLVGTLAFVVEDVALSRYRVDVKDNRHARRVRTQIQLLRRITVAVLVVVAVAAVLLTFPGVSAFGASLLASAGVLSVVAGLAAQSSLSNVFAGLQIAFTDAIRVDDVVIVEQQWGRIEEITLTYVVVHVWDDRRLILPSTYFTQTPFENWTRRAAELLGTVELDVDWQVPVDDMRGEFNRLLAATDLWDHRVGVLQVTDAVGGVVRLRALASAADAPTLFDLRCYLREGLVAWLQREAPQGLPRTRIETSRGAVLPERSATPAGPTGPTPRGAFPGPREPATATGQLDARLFTGTVEAIERSRSFAGPGQDVIAEREEHAAEGRREDEAKPGRSTGGAARVDAPPTEATRIGTVTVAGAGADGAAASAPTPTPAPSGPFAAEEDGGAARPGDDAVEQREGPTGGPALTSAASAAPAAAGGPVVSGRQADERPTAPAATTAPVTPGPGGEPTGATVVTPVTPAAPDVSLAETQQISTDVSGTIVLPGVPADDAARPAARAGDGPHPSGAAGAAADDEPRPSAPTRRSVRSAPVDPNRPPR